MRYTSATAGYLALAVNDRADMEGGDAVIGTAAEVAKYDLNGMSVSDVVKQAAARQDLTQTSYTHANGVVSVRFARPLAAPSGGKSIRASGSNIFLWARGGPTVGYHGSGRGIITLDLANCASGVVDVDKSKFTAHAWLMALGWGVVIPLGALFSSMTRVGGGSPVWEA